MSKWVKRVLSVVLAAVMVGGVIFAGGLTASAATSGIYTYSVSGGVARIDHVDTSASGAVIIPSTLGGYPVTSIWVDAFFGCSKVTSITVPKNITSIGNYAFGGCSSLTAISVVADNPNYSSDGGVLFNKAKTTLLQYPGGKSGAYTIPSSITSIGNYAFSSCELLTSVIIPNSVKTIGLMAFLFCPSLTSVTIPSNVTSIGENAFYDCGSLTARVVRNSYAEQYCKDNNIPYEYYGETITPSVISDGLYAIVGKTSGKAVTSGNYRENGVDCFILDYNPESYKDQVFRFQRQPDGSYVIISNYDGRYLEVEGASKENGAPVQTWDFVGQSNVYWNLYDAGNGYYKIMNRFSGKVIDIYNNGTADYVAVNQWEDNGTDAQLFRLERLDGGNTTYTISYDANGGTGAPAPQTKTKGVTLTLPSTMPTRKGYIFCGWQLYGTLFVFQPGEKYTMDYDHDMVMKAIWDEWALTYNFANTHQAFFGHPDDQKCTYPISDSDFIKLSNYVWQLFDGGEVAAHMIDALQTKRKETWNGSCYGMAVTTILNQQGKVDIVGNYDPGKTYLHDVRAPYENPALRSAITYYQISQDLSKLFWVNDLGLKLYNKNTDAAAWTKGLRALAEEAKTSKPILFNYKFEGSDSGHAIVIKGYQAAANGGHNLLAYDNRYPNKDTIVYINAAFTTLTVKGKADENAYLMSYTSDLSGFDNIDIDGPANNFVLATPKPIIRADTVYMRFDANSSTITITNSANKTLKYDSTTGKYSGALDVTNQWFVVNSTADGEPAAATICLEVPDSNKFTFSSAGAGIDASIVSGSLYASGSSDNANTVIIEKGKGVVVSGSDPNSSFDYTASLGINNQLCDTVLLSGTATGSVTVQPKDNAVLVSGGTGETRLTVFSNTVDMEDIVYTAPEGDVIITETDGNIDVRVDSNGDGSYDKSLLINNSDPAKKWWESLPGFLQFILRWFLFGWIWM